jgi:hypothetical protein
MVSPYSNKWEAARALAAGLPSIHLDKPCQIGSWPITIEVGERRACSPMRNGFMTPPCDTQISVTPRIVVGNPSIIVTAGG